MINKISFKGYDARPLQGLMTTDKTSADALQKISKDTGIEVYRPNITSKSIKKERFELSRSNKLIWAQDYITALNHNVKAVLYDGSIYIFGGYDDPNVLFNDMYQFKIGLSTDSSLFFLE